MSVPTVDLALEVLTFCSMAMAGQMPLMKSTSGFFHPVEKLAGIRRKAFNIAPLPFGIKGVHDERRLAGARQAHHHDEFVFGNKHFEVAQVVEPGAFDVDEIFGQFFSVKGRIF